ncbi:MAG: hypothetical protein M1817_006893 [Caeruleum heppii]|nr:MAG: hypothetical protein M1817_006893 [Caeruleum heppii]
MIPGDGSFAPYNGPKSSSERPDGAPPTNGRIFVLKFSSSSQRYLFWLQSKNQSPNNDPAYFSARDGKLGQIVNSLLQGDEVDVSSAMAGIDETDNNGDDGDDETMEDVEGTGEGAAHHRGGSGGAGAGATGGDIREEGETSREGGADGGRAGNDSATEASAIVKNFLDSLQGTAAASTSQRQPTPDTPSTSLPDLLPTSTTIPVVQSAPDTYLDHLLSLLPPTLLLLAQEVDDLSSVDPNSETAQAAIQALSSDQKKDIITKVLRSPQFHQSLGSLTVALRDGGLPSIAEALKIPVENGGFMKKGGGMPIGGGEAVEAFLNGIRKVVEAEEQQEEAGRMETE